jgi:hypothetical protein
MIARGWGGSIRSADLARLNYPRPLFRTSFFGIIDTANLVESRL